MSRNIRLAVALLLALHGAGRGELLFFKDGLVLQGKIKRGGTTIIDPASSTPIHMPQGAFFVDDGVRRIYFSPSQLDSVDEKATPDDDLLKFPREIYFPPNTRMLAPIVESLEMSPWDEKWNRQWTVRSVTRKVQLPIHLDYLSPRYARARSTSFFGWAGAFLTQELGPTEVRALLASHPDLKHEKERPDMENGGRSLRAAQFLVYAGWLDQADQVLVDLGKALPSQKERAEAARANIRRAVALERLEAIRTARAAGRHGFAQTALSQFPEADADDKLLGRVNELRGTYQTGSENLKQARRLLAEAARSVSNFSQRIVFNEAVEGIDRQLTLDNMDRLNSFLTLAREAELRKQAGGKAEQSPEQLLALAVSGWLFGNNSAEPKVEAALRLWRGRQFAARYLTTDDAGRREALLRDYAALGTDTLSAEEMEQLVRHLPPPRPPEQVGPEPVEWKTGPGGDSSRPVTYHFQAPPEYTPGRAYPMLIVLHQSGERAADYLRRWSAEAAKHGYLLAAPEWDFGLAGAYSYSVREHHIVTDVLREVRRRYQVDSDRVFLHGLGHGASMAYDVALSHPDLFAGVVPMGGSPGPFARHFYWRNAQYLPFYAIGGDWVGEARREIKGQFDEWVPRGYPSMWVEYRGRGVEWFGAELPYIFDWMGRKKRALPLPELGKSPGAGKFGQEMQSMRPSDNRFYWLSATGTYERNQNDAANWDNRVIAATLYGRIGDGNAISLQTYGVKGVTLWLSRGMVDFAKPLQIAVNLKSVHRRKAEPKLGVLLEDLYERGDRQRPVVAKVEIEKI